MSFVVESSALVVPDPYWNCGSATTRSKSIKTPHSRDHVDVCFLNRSGFFLSLHLHSKGHRRRLVRPPGLRLACVPRFN